MATGYSSNELCVSLQADLNGEGTTNLPGIQVVDENLTNTHNDPVLIQTLPAADVNLPSTSNVQAKDGSLPVATPVSCICRICAAVIDVDSAVNLFPNHEFEENVAYKVNNYLPIYVYESDPFPKKVCKTCVDKLNQFHDLSKKCVSVEKQFKQSCVYDKRYIDKVMEKINRKSDPDPSKQDSESTPQLCTTQDSLITEQTNRGKDSDILDPKGCGPNLKDLDNCTKHSLIHVASTSNDHFLCSVCSLPFRSQKEWEFHIKTHSDTNGQGVKITQTPGEKEKAKEIKKDKRERNNKIMCCKKCKEELGSVDAAVEHCIKHKPASFKAYPCVLCVRIIGQFTLKDHVSLHYKKKTILTCDVCNETYPNERSLKHHKCKKLWKYKCSQCNQMFKSEKRLKFHEDFHKNSSTFCDFCKKEFKFESKMYLHFTGVHKGIREKPYCCDVCGKTFPSMSLLNLHKRIHTNERPYKCPKCDARFYSKYYLTGHMPSHEDHPKFHCDKCEYYTGRKINLQQHIHRFHREIKASQACIQCKICNEIFPNKLHFDVEEHFSKHYPNEDSSMMCSDSDMIQELVATKLFQCERCERCYISLEHLTEHRETHADDDPSSIYHCRLCDRAFPKHDLLVKHQKLHTQITSQYTETLSVLTVIICDICGIECVDYRQLVNHKDRGNCLNKKISGTVKPKKALVQKHLKRIKLHQFIINSDGLFECTVCHKTFISRRRYRLHLTIHPITSF